MQLFEANGLQHILCMGAHADDIEIGCGGTIRHLISRNQDLAVTWIVFSAAGLRIMEARESAKKWLSGGANPQSVAASEEELHSSSTLNKHDVRVLDFADSRFPAAWSQLKDYFCLLSSSMSNGTSPDLIFTHRLHDRHQDHRIIAELTWQAFRNHCIFEYEIPKYEGDLGLPNVYVPLPDSIASEKCELLSQGFPSQAHHHWFDEETFRSLMRLRAIEAGGKARYAEAFEAKKLLVQ